MALPTWAPVYTDVGAHVPMRTIALGDPTNAVTSTFSASTLPSAAQVDVFIAGAVGLIEARVGTVATTHEDLAKPAAAVRAAADVELAQPGDVFDQAKYDQLVALADALLDRLVSASAAITGVSGDLASALMPTYMFPVPSYYGDWDL